MDYHTQPTEANGSLGTANCACCECSAGGANSALIGFNPDSHHSIGDEHGDFNAGTI